MCQEAYANVIRIGDVPGEGDVVLTCVVFDKDEFALAGEQWYVAENDTFD
jgi:hypothetical protein